MTLEVGLWVLQHLRRREEDQEAAPAQAELLLEASWSCPGLVITTAAVDECRAADNTPPPDTRTLRSTTDTDTDPSTEAAAPSTKIGETESIRIFFLSSNIEYFVVFVAAAAVAPTEIVMAGRILDHEQTNLTTTRVINVIQVVLATTAAAVNQ